MSLRRRLAPALAALTAAVVAVPLVAAPATAAPSKPKPPRVYYLAVGDSLAYGYMDAQIQAQAPTIQPETFPGYVEPFADAYGAATGHKVETVNLSCPGETTESIRDRCGFAGFYGRKALHDPYKGSQLDAALKFLHAHGAKTEVITVSLGSNDLRAGLAACGTDQACLVGVITSTVQRLAVVLAELRAAAPGAELVVFDIYNVFEYIAPQTEALVPLVNGSIQAAAASVGAVVAPAYAPINGATDSVGEFCTLVAICSGDIHPTPAGYDALADSLAETLGVG